jgi:hypothetical protein
MMQYIKWILLAICVGAVVWPLLVRPPHHQKRDSGPEDE